MTWSSPEPIAYFMTWTTYGSWLPGDERGWIERPGKFRSSDPELENSARNLMTESTCTLTIDQRCIVEETIRVHCTIRRWQLHTVNCRTQHVHVDLSALGDPNLIMRELKAWCTRKLKDLERSRFGAGKKGRENWWTERGSKRPIFDEEGLEAAIIYVKDCQ